MKKKGIIIGAIVIVVAIIVTIIIKNNMEYVSKEEMLELMSKPTWDNYKMLVRDSNDNFNNLDIYKKDNITKIIFNVDSRYVWMNEDTSEVYLVKDGEVVGTQPLEDTGAYKNINEEFVKDIFPSGEGEYKYKKREKINGIEYIVFEMLNWRKSIFWVNSETGIIEKAEHYENGELESECEYKVEEGVVQDSDIVNPNA